MHMFISSFFHFLPIKTGCFGVETCFRRRFPIKSCQAFPERLRLPAAAPTTQAGR